MSLAIPKWVHKNLRHETGSCNPAWADIRRRFIHDDPSQGTQTATYCKAGVRMKKNLRFIGTERKSRKKFHLDRGQKTNWEMSIEPMKMRNNKRVGQVYPVGMLIRWWSPERYVAILACCAAISGCSTTSRSNEAAAPKPEADTGKLLFSEPFDYPTGERLSGKNGGTGFAQAWSSGGFNSGPDAPHVVADASLAYENLSTSGKSCKVAVQDRIVGMERPLAHPEEFAKPGSTRYVSVVMRPEGKLGDGPLNGFFGLCLRSTEGELFVGKPGNEAVDKWVMEERGGSAQVATAFPVVANQATLLVLKIECKQGNDRLTLYVNPKPGEAEPTNGTVKDDAHLGLTDTVLMYSTGAFSMDELRAGETFQSVSPIKK